MGFVRAKKIKGKKYAYLVENLWKKGKVKQKVKKYLGAIVELSPRIDPAPAPVIIDFSQPTKHCIALIIKNELFKRGFIQKRQTLTLGEIKVNFSRYTITKSGKSAVILINGRYLYSTQLRYLINFFEPEEYADQKGEKLAQAFSDAGISISSEHFIALYKKMYVDFAMIRKDSE